MKLFDHKLFKKLIAISAFISILFGLAIINIYGAASGYEISIYQVYPIYLWILLIISMICGIIIMVTESFNECKSNFWFLGFLIIIFSDFIILLLPFIRGYFTFGRGDVLSHIGYAKDIILSGHFGVSGLSGENFYPIIHLLISVLTYLTGIKIETTILVLPIFFFLIYTMFIYLLSSEITHNNKQSILITSFASILLFTTENLAIAPSIEAFFLLPLLLFLFFKANSGVKGSIMFGGLFISILLLMPFLHPGEGTIFLIPLFIGIYVSILIFKRINRFKKMPENVGSLNFRSNLFTILLIVLVSWFSWFVSFSVFGYQIKGVINWLLYEIGTTNTITFFDLLGKAHLSLFQLIDLTTKIYGQQMFYIILAALISIVTLKNFFVGKTNFKQENFTISNVMSSTKWKKVFSSKHDIKLENFIFTALFLIFFVLTAISFSNFVGVEGSRSVRYIIFISTILIGISLYDYIKQNSKFNYHSLGIILIICFIGISGIFGIFNTFASPITKNANYQVTQMEIIGMNWFLANGNNNLTINSIEPQQIIRYIGAIVGEENIYAHIKSLEYSGEHFNYTINNHYGESFKNDTYFIDWKLQKILYPELFPEYENVWKFKPDDFNHLENEDPTVNSIYSNGEFWIFYISHRD